MSNNTLARLSVELAANTAAFQTDMGKAARVAEKDLKSIGDAATKMGGLLGAGLAAAAGAFAALAKQSINSADELGKTSAKIGMSTEKLSAYSYIAKLSGSDTEAFSTAMKKLNVNVVDAARGQGTAKDALAALGIQLKDQNGKLKDSDTIFREVSTRMSTFEDGAVKTALATDIMGKAGADLIPMMNEGAVGFDRLTGEAKKMGEVISGETAKSAAEFNDDLDRMKMAIGGTVNQVVAQMLPTFKQMAADMAKSSIEGGVLTGIANGLGVAFKVMVTGGYMVAAVLEYIGTQAGMAGATLGALLTGDFAAAKNIMSDSTAGDQFSKRIEGIAALWDKTAVSAGAAAVAQEKALGATPDYATAKGKTAKVKSPKKEKDQFSDAEILGDIKDYANEAGAANAIFDRDKARVQSALQSIQQGLMTKRQLEIQDFEQKKVIIEQTDQYLLMNKQQQLDTIEALEREHKGKLKALDDAELQQKQDQRLKMIGMVNNGLATIAGSQSKYAKIAQAAQKVQTLWQIGTDTRAMMVGAYKAMVGIPVIGPALAVAAAGAAFAFGAVQASAVGGSVGGSSSVGSAGSVASTGSMASAEPVAKPSADAMTTGTTILNLPENAIMTARQIADMLDDVYASGKQPQYLRAMLT